MRWLVATLRLLALGIGLGAVGARGRGLPGELDQTGLRRVFDADTWWGIAAVYTSNGHLTAGTTVAKSCARGSRVVQGSTYGALFITLNAGGDPDMAEAYFKTINGETVETFSIVKHKHVMRR